MTCQGTLPSSLILCLPPFLHPRLHSLCRAKCLRHLSCAMSLGVSDCLSSTLGACVSWWVLVSALLVSLSDHLWCLSLSLPLPTLPSLPQLSAFPLPSCLSYAAPPWPTVPLSPTPLSASTPPAFPQLSVCLVWPPPSHFPPPWLPDGSSSFLPV